MVLFAWTSWIRCAETHLTSILATITSITVRNMLGQSYGFWSLSICWLQLISMDFAWLYDLTLNVVIMTGKTRRFVGAEEEVNCNQFNRYDTLTKKNTQISRLSVLGVVCYEKWALVIPIVAFCANIINTFASCYV